MRPRPKVLILHLTPLEANALATFLDEHLLGPTLERVKAKLGAEMIRKKEAKVQP